MNHAPHHRAFLVSACLLVACCATAPDVHAGPLDVTVFLGRAYPVYDERLTIRPSLPSFPGVDVTVSGTPEIRTDGGAVIGGALAFELGILAQLQAWRAEGRTLNQIAAELNARMIPTKRGGRQWWPATVAKILDAQRSCSSS